MTWKRKSPQAYRRQRHRRQQRHWSHAVWLQLEVRLWRDMGMSGLQLKRAARAAARYVVGGGGARRVMEMANAHARAIAQRWAPR